MRATGFSEISSIYEMPTTKPLGLDFNKFVTKPEAISFDGTNDV